MSTNIIQQMKAIEVERERMFAIYCADTGAGAMRRPFNNYRAGYQAATSRQEAKVKALVEALEYLMLWQVKNIKVWHNDAYDKAVSAIQKAKETP